MVITLYFFGRPSSGHPTICVRWPVNNCMMFVSLSGHQSSIVRWSVKTFRCLSNFRPVFCVTLHRSKKTFRVTLSNISSEGVCTVSVRCLLLWQMCSRLLGRWGPMLGHCLHRRLPPVYDDRTSNVTKALQGFWFDIQTGTSLKLLDQDWGSDRAPGPSVLLSVKKQLLIWSDEKTQKALIHKTL